MAVLGTNRSRLEHDLDHHQGATARPNLPADTVFFERFERDFGIGKENMAHRDVVQSEMNT
jgi:hypothetical protein